MIASKLFYFCSIKIQSLLPAKDLWILPRIVGYVFILLFIGFYCVIRVAVDEDFKSGFIWVLLDNYNMKRSPFKPFNNLCAMGLALSLGCSLLFVVFVLIIEYSLWSCVFVALVLGFNGEKS